MDTAYDGFVDFRHVLQRELAVHDALDRHGIAAPRVLTSDTSRLDVPWSWILTEYLAHEPITSLSESQSRELGAITRRIHAIPGSDVHGPVLGGAEFRSFMRERVLLRLANLSESAAVPGDPAAWSEAFDQLTSGYDPAAGRLLHMDIRAENVCVADGKIVAVLDVTNAMVGDPRCEIGRLVAYGVATDEFLAGYGVSPGEVRRDPVIALYTVDTTAMLALLARDELDDDDMERTMVRRTAELLRLVLD